MRGHGDLRAIVAASALCAVLAVLLPLDLLQSALRAAPRPLLPRLRDRRRRLRPRHPIDRAKLLLLGVGLSLAVLALGGLVLNYVPGGMRSGSWALLLWLVVLAACRAAALRRAPATGDGDRAAAPAPRRARSRAARRAPCCSARRRSSSPSRRCRPSTRSATPSSGSNPSAGGRRRPPGSASAATSSEPTSYFLRVRFGPNGRTTIRRLRTASPARAASSASTTKPRRRIAPVPVHAALFRSDEPYRAYRRVSTWVAPPSAPG